MDGIASCYCRLSPSSQGVYCYHRDTIGHHITCAVPWRTVPYRTSPCQFDCYACTGICRHEAIGFYVSNFAVVICEIKSMCPPRKKRNGPTRLPLCVSYFKVNSKAKANFSSSS
ncbi:hypothetical protein ElyMa_006160300 [Elysia marginata]|uniref:Uncharacterized protein n=1 Tax=Elysia marginata TaxID=1093978 RepID=A0AAV4GZL5_9GAST|nr:hypothetical protein ElyMa_006160300 [Elysia marginata]